MNGADVLDIAQEGIWVLIKMSGPVMFVALFVGLIIALFQALTQIQEITLTFVPKIIAIFVSLFIFLPYMGETMSDFMGLITERIVNLG
ncbi:MAG: flagellar biosynthesis protein FliQ [Alphaproteobacteria bacterium]|nr:flagellar biosynthesis protein FliQ [Emcibacter sp.]NOZ67503.1 flagellar biosynthesis protein FliQ [Alphaproteobacteria bacterium]